MDYFPVGGPVSPADVVDREPFLDQLVTRLTDRHSVVLAGPRRTGKSTVAYEALRRLRDREGCLTAAVDLSTTPTVRELAEKLTAACLGAVDPAAQAAIGLWQGLGRLLRMPEVRARMHELELTVALRPEAAPDPDRLLEEALALPERLGQREGRLFAVLFDEFQTAAALGGDRLLSKMRGAFQLQQRTSFLFLGSQAGMMAQLFGSARQPFFRFATFLSLPPAPDDAWRAYIRQRLRDRGIEVEDAATDVILEATGGHPYDTMQAAYEGYLLAERGRRLDGALASAACAEAQMRLHPVFEAELDALGTPARVLLARIARGEPLYPGARSSSAVDRQVHALITQGVIRRVGHGRYELAEPMLARHLAGELRR